MAIPVKKIIIAGLTSIAMILFILSQIQGVIITSSGDITCAGNKLEPCISYFNITSNNYSIKIYNATKQNVYFDKDIANYTVYRLSSAGNWYKTNFPINFTKGTLYQFKIVAYKKSLTDTIKWGVQVGDADADPLWSGYSADDFFIELISNKADLTYGEAVFKVKNPTSFNFTVDAINNKFGAKFTKYLGNDINSWDLDVLVNKSYSNNITDYTWVYYPYWNLSENGTMEYFENRTQAISGWHWNNYTNEEWRNIKLNDVFVSGKTYTIRLTANWNAHLGQQSIEWFPQIIIQNTSLIQDKWAWWNTTFAKCRNISFSGMVTDVNYTNEWGEQNFTDLTFSSLNEMRIVNASCNGGGSNQDRDIINNGTTWATVGWYVNYTQTDANHNYSIYYDAIGAGDPATTNIFGIENTTNINTSSTTNLNGYHAYRDRYTSYKDSTCVKNSTGYRISSEIDGTPICLSFHDGTSYIFGSTAWWRNESYKGNLTYVLNMNLSTTYNVTYRFYKDYFTATINLGVFGAQHNKLNLSSASGGLVVASMNDSSNVVQNFTSGDNHVDSGENWTASYNNLSQYVWGLFGKNLNSTALGNRLYIGSVYQPMAEIGEDYNGGGAMDKRIIAGSVIRWQIISYDSSFSNNNTRYIMPVHNVYRAFNNPLTIIEGSEQTQGGGGGYPLNLYFNGTVNANKTYTYPSASNATGTVTAGETGYLYRDNVLKSTATKPNETIVLGNGTYAYKLNSTNNATGLTYYVLVNKGASVVHLALNQTENNKTYTYGQVTNATGWVSTPSDETGNLYRNGTLKNIQLVYDNWNFSTVNSPLGLFSNGTYFWITDPGAYLVKRYNSSGVYDNWNFIVLMGATGVYYNGTYFWVLDNYATNNITRYNSSGINNASNFTVSGQATEPEDLWFNDTYFWVVDSGTDRVYRYNSTGDYNNSYFDVSAQGTVPKSIYYNGTYFWIGDAGNGGIFRYKNDGTYDSWYVNVSAQDIAPVGLSLNSTYIWVAGDVTNKVYRYNYTDAISSSEVIQLGADLYNYSFNYSGNANYTSATVSYFANVTQAPSNITLYLNGTQNNLTVNYPNSTINVTATINDTNTNVSIMKNGTILNTSTGSVSYILKWGVQDINFTANFSGNANITSSNRTRWTFINKGPTNATLWINGTQANQTSRYPNSTLNVTATSNVSDLYVQVWRNGTLLINTTSLSALTTKWGAWSSNFSVKILGNANYSDSASISTRWWNVSAGIGNITLFINGSTVNNSNQSANEIINLTVLSNISEASVNISLNATGFGDNFQTGTGSVINITNTSKLTMTKFNFTGRGNPTANFSMTNSTIFFWVRNISISVEMPTGTSNWLLNVSSCTPLTNCYQTGNYTPINQSLTQWFYRVNNTGAEISNVTLEMNTTFPSCINWFIANSSNYLFQPSNAWNISNTTAQRIYTNLGTTGTQNYWTWATLNNCSVNTSFSFNPIFTAVVG